MLKPTPDFDWNDYFDAADSGTLHPLFERLTSYLSPELAALDLGCGVGHGAVRLANAGLHVTAVDIHREALDRLKRRVPEGASLTLIESDFRALALNIDAYDVVTATNALYFLSCDDFVEFWPRLTSWIRAGGIFMGQFMGVRDAWAGREDYCSLSPGEVKDLFQGFEMLYFHEDERDSVNLLGRVSHVHVMHALARKALDPKIDRAPVASVGG